MQDLRWAAKERDDDCFGPNTTQNPDNVVAMSAGVPCTRRRGWAADDYTAKGCTRKLVSGRGGSANHGASPSYNRGIRAGYPILSASDSLVE